MSISKSFCCLLLASAALPILASGQEQSVKPGINEKFLADPKPTAWVERFEKEGREVYDKRGEIIEVCEIEPGQDVADIGAGTGLFTRLFAPAVGRKGKVYAVDIARTFVTHTVMSSHARGWKNVEGVVCDQDSTNLPPESIDLAFVCATYHHFEFPFKSLASIHRALRPGGRLVVVDFERVEGKSSDFILGHVRAGKDVVLAEIAKAGFELVEEKQKLFKENYLVIFRKEESADASAGAGLFDLAAIRDSGTLETRVIHDWQPAKGDPAVQQKLVEITVAEWWPGQKVRIPVTLSAPSDPAKLPCRNVLVINMGLAPRTARVTGVPLELLKEDGAGIVQVGIGTIDAMAPAGELHLGMKEQLLATRDARYSPAWIWGMSWMRGLTAAAAEPARFAPEKVVATGGSKRGIATAVAGIHDDRFTAIMPVVAPPLGNPGAPTSVIGNGPAAILKANRAFLAHAEPGIRASLEARAERRAATRVTLEQARNAGWTDDDIAAITGRIWNASRMTRHLDEVRRRGLEFFYLVGSNDSVSPALVQLGESHPDFPIHIVPGGQHGGPADAGFTARVPGLPVADENLRAFCRHHFFDARPLPPAPQLSIDDELTVRVEFTDGITPEKNEVHWSFDRHPPYTLDFEYDAWESLPLQQEPGSASTWTATIPAPAKADTTTVEVVTTHRHTENGIPFTFSSPLRRVRLP